MPRPYSAGLRLRVLVWEQSDRTLSELAGLDEQCTGESIPLACMPGASPAAERPTHRALIQRLFGETAIERHTLPSG